MTARDEPSTKPLLDKLGVKPGQLVSLAGIDDDAFVRSLRERGADVSVSRLRSGSDVIFLGVPDRRALSRIASAKRSLARDGALWTVRPKGVKHITEAETMRAGLDAGLVDVKVVSFSPTHTAEKFVYRMKDR